MLMPESTLRCIYDIASEEPWPKAAPARLWLRLQSMIDWSFWVRRVDLAIVGGDPILIAERLVRAVSLTDFRTPLRVAVLHPGSFSGAPLALLGDDGVREQLSMPAPGDGSSDPARDVMLRVIDDAIPRVTEGVFGGILATDLVQGCFDVERRETVLRLARDRDMSRMEARKLSGARMPQILNADAHLGRDVFSRSESLFETGMSRLWLGLENHFEQPAGGRRFADVIVARRVEVLSGFVSAPGRGAQQRVPLLPAAPVYKLAQGAPRSVEKAMDSWRSDLEQARRDPIFAEE